MPSSVLGKRARLSSNLPREDAIETRAKRRTRNASGSDENRDPHSSLSGRGSGAMEVDELESPIKTPIKSIKGHPASLPAKHTVTHGRIALSPTKINSHFRATKAVLSEDTKPLQNPTPQTPRHRDALSKTVPFTPRHRVGLVGKPQTPRTPRTPSTPSHGIQTIYNVARQVFVRSAHPGRLIGRDDERKILHNFIETRLHSTTGGCLYVSGPPGTGKSALVQEVFSKFEGSKSLKTIVINCMSIRSSKDLYSTLNGAFIDQWETQELENEKRLLQKTFTKNNTEPCSYLVVLDEVDHLVSLDLEVLYTLFEWALQQQSQLILIGIANALDLTDRFLPRLKVRNLKPQLLPFLPYTAAQIASVITERLKSLLSTESDGSNYVPFLHPAAIQLCSRKVSSQTGDLRKAFDICRGAIELIETEIRKKHNEEFMETDVPSTPSKLPLTENMNLSSPSPSVLSPTTPTNVNKTAMAESLAKLTVETAPRASIAHIARVTSAAFGKGSDQRLKTLNLQQKAALCALFSLEKKKKAGLANDIFGTPTKLAQAAPTMRSLFDFYSSLCNRDRLLQPLTSTEFKDVIGSLESLSLVSEMDPKDRSSFTMKSTTKKRRLQNGVGLGDETRITSCVGERELAAAVDGMGAGILQSLLKDGV